MGPYAHPNFPIEGSVKHLLVLIVYLLMHIIMTRVIMDEQATKELAYTLGTGRSSTSVHPLNV